jgi:uncharacterized membrane protein
MRTAYGLRESESGAADKEVQAMKARLYRTALTVSMVAVLLEGLGAGWKWS